MTPRLLDVYCCEGGASKGYTDAGFEVYGVDLFQYINAAGKRVGFSQKRYPYPSRQHEALDALEILLMGSTLWFAMNTIGLRLRDFAAIHTSPPCQRYSITNAARKADYPDLVGPTRDLLKMTGLPYVIENVVGAPLEEPVELCWTGYYKPGSVVDDDGTPLQMFRHRLFESNVDLFSPGCNHDPSVQVAGSYGGARRDKREAREIRHGGYVPSAKVQAELLGIDWMTQKGMHQSIPPAYTEHVGHQLMEVVS